MSTRRDIFVNGEYYHIFNRGVDKREIFSSPKDYERFLIAVDLLNDNYDGLMIEWRDFKKSNPKKSVNDFLKGTFRKRESLVEVLAYCLNPNHFHFILKQVRDKGIERFLHKLGTSHTKYYNKKNKRSGALFQGVFKSIHVDSNEYLLYLSAYVNKNNFIHGYNKNDKWPYSSLHHYLGAKKDKLIKNSQIISSQFRNQSELSDFFAKNAKFLKDKKEMERYILED